MKNKLDCEITWKCSKLLVLNVATVFAFFLFSLQFSLLDFFCFSEIFETSETWTRAIFEKKTKEGNIDEEKKNKRKKSANV